MVRSSGGEVRQPAHDLAGSIDPHGFTRIEGARHVNVRQSHVAGPEERVERPEAVVVHLAGRLTERIDADRRALVESKRAEVQQASTGPDKRMVDPTVVMGPTSNLPRCIDATGLTRGE